MKKIIVLLATSFLLLAIGFSATAQSLSVATTIVSNVSCYGGSNGSINATPSGGSSPYTYLWLPSSQTNQTASNLIAATYTILVTDNIGTTVSASVNISQPTALSITAWATYSAVCGGQPDSLFVSGTGGTVPYSYHWSAPFDDISNPSGDKTNSYPYGAAYIVSGVNDLNGCTASTSVSIVVHPIPLVSIAGPINPIAPSRSDTLVASALGATSYLWSNSATTSSIIVSPSVSTTYSLTVTNIFSCYDTTHYTIDTNTIGDGKASTTAIRIVPNTNITTGSYSSTDSVVWFKFIPTDSNNQIIATSAYLGLPTPHTHRLTLYDNSLSMLIDQPMPDIVGANQIRLDISHLHIGNTYYVRASRCPAHANMAGCNPSASGECNASQRWDFQMCFRTVPVFVPNDSSAESPAMSQLYYECRGQIEDLNGIPRFDIKAYTNSARPAVYCSDSAVSFVYSHVDTVASTIDTVQRVDMVLTGSSVEPSQPVFKMEEDSGAGYLNYYLGYVPNGVPKVEGYSRLVYKNVYPNIDMHVYSNDAGTKLYFVCNPTVGTSSGGNPADIELQFKGATSVSATGGSLKVVTELGTLNFAPGFAYTDSAGIIKPKSWQAYFISVNSTTVRFNTGAFNSGEPLIIQVDRGHLAPPSGTTNLIWSTYYGGSGNDCFTSVAYNFGGGVVAAGYSESPNFPVTNGVVQGTLAGEYDAVAVSFNQNNVRNIATYFGGSKNDVAEGVDVDGSENIIMTGYTYSTNFPLLASTGGYNQPNGLNGTNSGPNADAFIVSIDNFGRLVWSTFFGGIGSEGGTAVRIDSRYGILYVVGGQIGAAVTSYIPLWPKAGAYNTDTGTGWIAEFNVATPGNNYGKKEWITDIGGANGSSPSKSKLNAVGIDDSGNVYIAGEVTESGYLSPISNLGSFQGGSGDAVFTKFNTNDYPVWSTYYGGDGEDVATSINGFGYINARPAMTITGYTNSPMNTVSIPVTGGCYQSTYGATAGSGIHNAFIAQFNSNTGALLYGTYFGENAEIKATGSITDLDDVLFITGIAYPNSLPIPSLGNPVNSWNHTSANGSSVDCFIAAFSPAYYAYLWGTYFGGSAADSSFSAAVWYPSGHLYIVGSTASPDFPLLYSGKDWYQDSNAASKGNTDAFIAEFRTPAIDSISGVHNVSALEDGVKVYPNPTADNIMVQMELTQKQNIEFILYNIMGQMVYDKNIQEQPGIINQEIDLSLLPGGIYLLKVNEGNKYFTKKIVKED